MTTTQLLAYGALGLPLAFAALPVYVDVPRFYSERAGLSLAQLGVILLVARLLDALIDPLIGWYADRTAKKQMLTWALVPFAIGFIALFNPLNFIDATVQLFAALLLVYVGFSAASVAHQAAGAHLGRSPQQRTRLTASREGFGLLGVVLAALLPHVLASNINAGVTRLTWILSPLLLISALCTLWAMHSLAQFASAKNLTASVFFSQSARVAFADRTYRRLLAVFVVNGIAAALPATLFLFFVADVLRSEQFSGLLLGIYFVSGALSLPLWVAVAAWHGRVRAWMLSMVLAVVTFACAGMLREGDILYFALICLMSGTALGADLVLPAAIAADLGERKQRAGIYFGVWNFVAKMNLALAAGIVLPLLGWLGYTPGLSASTHSNGQYALVFAYALLPLFFKALAFALLWRWRASLEVDV